MSTGPLAPATLPPQLAGLDPAWSRLVEAYDARGDRRTWHVLDAGPSQPVGTLLCVHGNPTWSYLWRSVVRAASPRWRVVAVDHLGMGWSERTGRFHRLADRVAELAAVTDALDVSGPVVTVAHDWGGPVSLGWALDHRDQLAGVVLTNTAVHQPAGSPVPGLIALARMPGVLRTSTVRTPTFLRGTLRLAHPALAPDVRDAYLAPYPGPDRRQAIGDFVDDIPLAPDDPSAVRLAEVVTRMPELADVPTLLLWGPRDPVFSDRYLDDLAGRLPQAQVHRFERAGHLVVEDAPVADAVLGFADGIAVGGAPRDAPGETPGPVPAARVPDRPPAEAQPPSRPLWAALADRAGDAAPAVVECGAGGRTVTFEALAHRVRDLAAGLAAWGVGRGDRVALLVPPGADLTAAVYACWRAGAVIVVADAGLGLPGLRRALRGARPDHVIATARGLAAARLIGLPGRRVAAGRLGRAEARALGAEISLAELARLGRASRLPDPPGADDEAAVLFTSGATGPAKGVVYRHRQLQAQRDAVARQYAVTPDDRLVAAFAPFALYGPALGIPSAVPDMDVTAPGSLRASALAEAAAGVGATLVFASPASLAAVVASADSLDDRQLEALGRVRLLVSAGAPVPTATLRAASALMGGAAAHTPYGMTEVLPVTDVSLDELDAAGPGDGVCVGAPVPGVEVGVAALDATGRPVGEPMGTPGVTGEVCVRAAHVKDRYDRLWVTERATRHRDGWHRTGDVGHLDDTGRLWVEGRLGHVVTTADGAVTPVGVERRVSQATGGLPAAVVGVGPAGTQAVAVVVVPETPGRTGGLADPDLTRAVREAAGVPVAAVLTVPSLPVDIRHNSKVDRSRLAGWAERVLAGGRAGTP